MFDHKSRRGFTLIELLVVVAIISLLASVVMASLNSAREKVKTAKIAADFKEMEKAFLLLADEENISEWWPETDFGVGGNPDIDMLVTNPARLGKFLPSAPKPPGGTVYGFDNDLDQVVCGDGGTVYRGVNIHARGVPDTIGRALSKIFDGDENLDCGKITWTTDLNGSVFYRISDYYKNY